jgi:hypothetical protein
MRPIQSFAGLCVLLLGLAASHGQSLFTNGLIAYYPFSGNANDASGNGNHGRVSNAQLTTNRFGQPSTAYHFDGVQSSSGSRIVVTNKLLNMGQPGYTIQMWFKSYSDSQGGAMFNTYFNHTGIGIVYTFYNAPSYAGALIGSGSSWDLGLDQQRGAPLALSQLSSNNWYCATLTKTGTVYSFYVNGQLQFKGTNSLAASYNFNDGFLLGTSSGVNETFYGAIDDVRIYNRALSSNEVATIYYYESAKNAQLVKSYTVDFDGLLVGGSYQLQSSTNLTTWSNWGAPFTATSEKYTNAIPHQRVDNWSKLFFRLTPQ